MNNIRFREIEENDVEAVRGIYNHYVRHTTATFHLHPLSTDEMRRLVFFEHPMYSTYVIINENSLCGYCLLTQYKTREAYNHTAEVTIYLAPEHTGKGIGSCAVAFIEDVAKKRGIHVLIAVICGENAASIRLFEKNGYTKCGHYREVGKKFGRLLDVVSYQKILGNL